MTRSTPIVLDYKVDIEPPHGENTIIPVDLAQSAYMTEVAVLDKQLKMKVAVMDKNPIPSLSQQTAYTLTFSRLPGQFAYEAKATFDLEFPTCFQKLAIPACASALMWIQISGLPSFNDIVVDVSRSLTEAAVNVAFQKYDAKTAIYKGLVEVVGRVRQQLDFHMHLALRWTTKSVESYEVNYQVFGSVEGHSTWSNTTTSGDLVNTGKAWLSASSQVEEEDHLDIESLTHSTSSHVSEWEEV